MDNWLINGVTATGIAPDDRGLAYGDGLFETIAVRDGACRFLSEHMERLVAGCERLAITPPPEAELRADIGKLLGNVPHGTVKVIVTRGSGQRGYRAPDPCRPTRIVGAQQTEPAAVPATAIRLRYCATPISRNVLLAGLKTLNRLEQVMARSEWTDPDVAEGLLLDDRGHVICGTMSNLFVVRAGELCTPELSDCGIHGIMRGLTLSVAHSCGIPVQQATLTKADLESADDIFMTNSLIGIWPVAQLEERVYIRSEITRRLAAALFAAGVSECAA